jgi:RND family efflux transporter MFP subunit
MPERRTPPAKPRPPATWRATLRALPLAALLFGLAPPAPLAAQERFTVAPRMIEDDRPVFATVESVREVEARARLNGTLTRLDVREGDAVAAGQVIAMVQDAKHPLQLAAIDARLGALAAQRRQAALELERTRALRATGTATQARLDDVQTALDVVDGQIAAAQAEREVVVQQQREGEVLAPQAGRVLRVRGTPGAVVMPGEAIATIATDRYVLRLRLPERHARFLRAGDPVEVGGRGLGGGTPLGQGRIALVYPELQQGQVVADAEVQGLGDFFVGERVRVTIAADRREAILIPRAFLIDGPGVDMVRLASGALVPVQRGPVRGEEVEILSGLAAGDVLVRP